MKCLIVGAGGYGVVYSHYLKNLYEIVGFLDDSPDNKNKTINGIPIIGNSNDLSNIDTKEIEAVFSPIGNNMARARILMNARALGFLTPNYIDKGAKSDSVFNPNSGIYVLAGSTIMPYVEIGEFSMVSIGANIAHHTSLGFANFVSTGCNIGANISIGEYVNFGIGSTIMTGVKKIGGNAVIGAGAVVIKDVVSNDVVVGVPARSLNKT